MAEPTKAAGYSSRVDINGDFFGVRNFRVSRKVDVSEVGDTNDGRYKRHKATRKEASITFTLIADPTLIPAVAVGVFEGAYVPIVYYPFFDADPNLLYSFPDVLITEVGEAQDVNGVIEMNVSAVVNGEYILPSEDEART